MENITLLASIPAIMAAVEMLKSQGLPAKRAPLISLAVGLVFSLIAFIGLNVGQYTVQEFVAALAYGILAGLSASGFYDGARLAGGHGERGRHHIGN